MIFPLGSWFSVGVMSFHQECFYLAFRFMIVLWSVGFANTVIWKMQGMQHTQGQRGVVVGQYDSNHHRHSAWQRTEPWQVYGVTGMMEMDWVMGADRDTGVMEMGGAMGSIYSGDPGVNKLPSYLISSYHTTNHTLYLSQPLISLALPKILWILTAGWYHIFSPSPYTPEARTTLSQLLLCECRKRCGRVSMLGCLPSSSVISPHQMVVL